jgi:glycine/D-amino acid oxidase-like deaminating enzyme
VPDVIIIGGGIAGCSTAWYLSREGVDVLVLERDELNSHASGANAGSLHAQIQHDPFVKGGEKWVRRFLPALPFFRYAIDIWEDAAETLDADLEFSRDGGIIVAANAEQMRQIEAKSRFEIDAGLGTRLLDKAGLRDLAPYVADGLEGGAYCPVEGKASPLKATPAFAAAAIAEGARFLGACEVRDVTRAGGRFVVDTVRGRHTAEAVVNAAGTDVARVAAMVCARLDVQAYPIQLTVTEPVVPLVRHLVYSADDMLTLKQTHAGTLLIGGGWPARMDGKGRPQVCAESLSRNLAAALRVVPAVADVLVVRSWAAVVNGTENWLPILGELPHCPGFFINYVPWMGFTGGPAGGRIVADRVLGRPVSTDLDIDAFTPI